MAILHLKGADAFLDEADVDLVMDWTWSVQRTANSPRMYAIGRKYLGDGRRVYLHRLVLDAQPGQIVDHIDGNGLNNRRSNLRIVTAAQNIWNAKDRSDRGTSRFRGVFWDTRNMRWRAMICTNGKRRHLGLFDTEEAAAAAWDAACAAERDEIARRNFR